MSHGPRLSAGALCQYRWVLPAMAIIGRVGADIALTISQSNRVARFWSASPRCKRVFRVGG